mgnify:FL=1
MYLVFDVGGTFIKYALMDQKGKIYEKYKVPTPFQDGKVDDNGDEITPYTVKTEDGIAAFLEQIDIIYGKYSKEYQITGIAMSLPGQVNVNQGIVYGGGSLPYLDRVPLGNLISRRCGNVPVALENDAKCAALAEVWIGNAKDCKDACVLVFGTGIGGGIIIDRKVRHGVGMIAGEMSFLYDGLPIEDVDKIRPLEEINSKNGGELPNPCIWTQQASVQALRRKVADAKGLKWQEVNGEDIYEMAETDPEIQDILERMYYNIAWHCCNLYITLAPEIILIGGGISAQPKFMEGIIKYTSKLRRLSYIYERMKIDLCKFGNDSNLIGALFNFMQKYDLVK